MTDEPSTSYYERSRTFVDRHEARPDRSERYRSSVDRDGRRSRPKSTGGWLSMFGSNRKKPANRSFFRLPPFSLLGRSRSTAAKAPRATSRPFHRRPAGVRWRGGGGGRRPRDTTGAMWSTSRFSESGTSTAAPDDYWLLGGVPADPYAAPPLSFDAQQAGAFNQFAGPQFPNTTQSQYPIQAPSAPAATANEDAMAARFAELLDTATSSPPLATQPPCASSEPVQTPPPALELAMATDATSSLAAPQAAPAAACRDASDAPAPAASAYTVPSANAPAPTAAPGDNAPAASAVPSATAAVIPTVPDAHIPCGSTAPNAYAAAVPTVPCEPVPAAPQLSSAPISTPTAAAAAFRAKREDIGHASQMVGSQARSQADAWHNAYYFPETDADYGMTGAHWRGYPNEDFEYGADPWVELPEYGYPSGSYAYRGPRQHSSPWSRHRERRKRSMSVRRRSTSGSRRRGRRDRRSRRRTRYDDEEDEEPDSESDSESSSDDSDDYDESPRRSNDRKRHKHQRKESKKKKRRHYRRSICECDEYECWPRTSRPAKEKTQPPVVEQAKQPLDANSAQFPDFFEEVTEDYLAPGHPNYDAAFGGPVVRRTRSIRPLKDENVFQPDDQSSLMPRLTTSRQWKMPQQTMAAFPSYELAGVRTQPAEIQAIMPAGGSACALPLQRYGYGYDGQAFEEANVSNPAPRNNVVTPEFFCGICSCVDCPGDCWAYSDLPQSDLEERLRMDERQRLDFEERVRMQERMERLEERMWMYDRWGRRPTPRLGRFGGHGPAGEQFVEEGYDFADPNEAWSDGSEAESLYSVTGRTKSSRGQVPRERRSMRDKGMRASATERYRPWEQTRCSAHRRSSGSSTSGKRRKKGEQGLSEGARDIEESSEEAELELPEPAAAASGKPFSWAAAVMASSATRRQHFAWSSLYKTPSAMRGGKRVSYGGGGPLEDDKASIGSRLSATSRDVDGRKELSRICTALDEAAAGRRRSVDHRELSAVEDEAKNAEEIKGVKEETSTAVYDTAIGASETSASQAAKPASLEEVAPADAEAKDRSGFRTVAQQTEPPAEEQAGKLPEIPGEAAREAESQQLSLVADEKDVEKDMLNMTLSSTNLFPESGVVCIISLLALIWIAIIFVTSTAIHSDNATAFTSPETPATKVPPNEPNTSLPPYFCHTVRCLREGDYLRSLMDGLERPCDNFYRHVCDRWSRAVGRKHPQVPEAVSTDSQLQSRMQENLVAFVQNLGTGVDVKPASDLLTACQDRTQANSHSVNQAKDLFRNWAIGKWPLGSYDDGRLDDVWSLAGQLVRDLDLAVFVGMTVAFDPANTKKGIVAFFEAEPLPVLYQDDDRDLVTTALKEALIAFGVTDAAHIDVLAQEVLSAFNVFDGILDIDANNDDAKVSTLFKLDPGFSSMANAALGSHTILDVSSRVLLLNTGFLEIHLPAALRNMSTRPRIFLNHLGFRALVRMAAFLPDSLDSLRQLSLLESTGVRAPPDPLSLCVRALERAMPMCLLKALAVPLSRTGKAVWERRSIFDLETVFLRGLRRIRWIDELSLYTLSFRLQHWRFDALYPTDLAWDSSPCALISSSQTAPIERLVDAFSQRMRELPQQLQTGPDWRSSPPLSVWPQLDLPALAVRVPQGLLNGTLPSNDTLSTFQLTARVAVRLYAAIVPLLYTGTVFDREAALDISSDSQRRLDDLRECLMADWQSVRRRLHVQQTPWRELNAQRWFRDWLLEQATGLHLAVYAFRELMHVGRVWRVDFRLGNLKYVSSTQLFFLYYALDHCERSSGPYQRRRIRQRRPPAHLRVMLPLRHVSVFAREFQCAHRDLLRAESPCRIFDW
ncbi:hypothetical protein V5799_019978 [Amblyomma americanum]|uniref:Uncharacterized protein n=1 Tax=Amblyomma americanum TaxID=6943 RepID=A0AAQ4EVD1_AMBAM